MMGAPKRAAILTNYYMEEVINVGHDVQRLRQQNKVLACPLWRNSCIYIVHSGSAAFLVGVAIQQRIFLDSPATVN